MSTNGHKRLRVQHILVQPVLVWDDGDELRAGPQLEAAALPLSQVAGEVAKIPGQLAALEAQLLAAEDDAVAPKPNRSTREGTAG